MSTAQKFTEHDLRTLADSGPITFGLALRLHTPSLTDDFTPHLHQYLEDWTPGMLAMAIDFRSEGVFSEDLATSADTDALITSIREAIDLETLDYTDPLAFAYQRVIAPDNGQAYCEACDMPMNPDIEGEWIACPNVTGECLDCCGCPDHGQTFDD